MLAKVEMATQFLDRKLVNGRRRVVAFPFMGLLYDAKEKIESKVRIKSCWLAFSTEIFMVS